MTIPKKPPLSENGYVLDPESATEMARLLLQDRLINEIMGGLLPELENLDGIDRILDIGCGPGGWGLDMARSYPQKKITGIDISDVMLTHAKTQATLHGLENIQFTKMDARQRLEFPDQSFDLVNIRAAVGYVPRHIWPLLLKECARITRIGGILRFSDADRIGLTNSASFERYTHYITRLLSKLEYGFAVDDYTTGFIHTSGKLMHKAGYKDIRTKPYVLDFSYGTKFHPVQLQNVAISFQLAQTRLKEMKIATQEELESLYEAVIQDLGNETFCGIIYMFSFCGKKQ